MEPEKYRKYTIFENLIQKINGKYIAIPEDERKRNNRVLDEVVNHTLVKLHSNLLFNNLYRTILYGGSYYDRLKVGKPCEYDLDLVLSLPKILQPTLKVSNIPGYVHLDLTNIKGLEKKKDEAPKYRGLTKLLENQRLCSKKVKSWMSSLLSNSVPETLEIDVDGRKCHIKCRVVNSGPALTISVEASCNKQNFSLDIDLVPCFVFGNKDWPPGYRPNTSKSKKTFLVVPKSPSDQQTHYWRLSFQEQERELINNCAFMKPAIKLIKKVRDRHCHKIASYYIKTVFLWELDRFDWNKSLSFTFAMMLRKYGEYLGRGNIPYFWNKSNNLIGQLSDVTTAQIANKINNIADHIDRICDTKADIFDIVPYLLKSEEALPLRRLCL